MFFIVAILIGAIFFIISHWADELWPFIVSICVLICAVIVVIIVKMNPVPITEQGAAHTYSVYEYQIVNNAYCVSYVDELSEIHVVNTTQVVLDNEASEPYVIITTFDTINPMYAFWFRPTKLFTPTSTIVLCLSE